MKCIHCGSDTKYKDRTSNGGRCASCRHPFAFEPKTDTLGVADGMFDRAIKDVSADHTLFFTEHQLYYELNRRLLARKKFGCGSSAVIFLAAGGAAAAARYLEEVSGAAMPLAVGATGAALTLAAVTSAGAAKTPRRKRAKPKHVKVPFGTFLAQYLHKWVAVHGEIPKLLPPVNEQMRAAAAAAGLAGSAGNLPPDVTAYSFDRALITERADMAAMLVANRFHFENNCAILSFDKQYPEASRFTTILGMLRLNPRLMVFTVHDATQEGVMLAPSLRRDDWFTDPQTRIIDLGLRPRHAQDSNMVLAERETPREMPSAITQMLPPEEADWLAEGYRAHLSALRPARLMRAVYQGFARANEMSGDGGSDVGGFIWIDSYGTTGGGGDIYAADSFG